MKVLTWDENKEPFIRAEATNPDTQEVVPEEITERKHIALYLFQDEDQVTITDTKVEVVLANGQEKHISDCNSTNTLFFENVDEPPQEWFGYRYFYTTENGWVENDKWVDPRTVEPS